MRSTAKKSFSSSYSFSFSLPAPGPNRRALFCPPNLETGLVAPRDAIRASHPHHRTTKRHAITRNYYSGTQGKDHKTNPGPFSLRSPGLCGQKYPIVTPTASRLASGKLASTAWASFPEGG